MNIIRKAFNWIGITFSVLFVAAGVVALWYKLVWAGLTALNGTGI